MIKSIINTVLGGDVSRLHKNSQSIVDVFTKTVNQLDKVNTEIDSNMAKREARIAVLRAETTKLDTLKASNSKVINKLNSILKD